MRGKILPNMASCGSCDAERLALPPSFQAASHVNWSSPAQIDAWDQRQFRSQSPETFETEYKGVRGWCDEQAARWTKPKPLIEHTKEYMRAQYGFPCARDGGYCRCIGRVFYGQQEGVATLAALLRYNHSYKDIQSPRWGTCCGPCGGMINPTPLIRKQCFCSISSRRGFDYESAWMRPLILRQPSKPSARVCKVPATTDAWGRAEQVYITRVGPISLERSAYFDRGLQGDVQFSLIPALPKSGTIFITESIDYYYDAAKGPESWPGYPPLHPHHSNTLPVGYEQTMTKYGRGPFEDWYPWQAMSTADVTRGSGPCVGSLAE